MTKTWSAAKFKDDDFHGGRIRINSDEGAEVKIDDNGVRIIGPEGEKVIIDSTGVRINGKKLRGPVPPFLRSPADSIRINPQWRLISLEDNK